MQNFLNEKIDIEEFSDNIFAFRREVEQELNDTYVKLAFESGSEKFQDFNPNLRVKGQSSLAGSLYVLCDFYEDFDIAEDPEDDLYLKNQKFSKNIKQYLLKFQQLLDQDQQLSNDPFNGLGKVKNRFSFSKSFFY